MINSKQSRSVILAAATWVCLANSVSAVEHPGLSLIENYCFDCHDSDSQKGEVNLEAALEAKPLVKNMDLWKTVISRVENGDMPPKKKPQPKPEEKERLLKWIDREINHFDYSQVDNPGYEPVRRLTHIEFSNTLRDLLGLDLNLVADFPIDLSGKSGFENSANTLFLQPILMERYLSAGDKAGEAAVPLDGKPSADSAVLVAWPRE